MDLQPRSVSSSLARSLLKKTTSDREIVAQRIRSVATPLEMTTTKLEMIAELDGTAYVHVRPLATGGMGEVHVVRHLELREDRVMKIVHVTDPESAEGIAKRMLSEGRLLRGLRHPNIVELLDLGRTRSGRPFLVTELLLGRTLRDEVVERRRLPWTEVADILLQILDGLEVAHNQGIVHRDIKPLNLFYLGTAGDARRPVKILDFGIAKALSADALSRAGSALVATREGFFLGSPAFMPPEQAIGGTVDARSDLYAVGAVGFYLLTGQVLFPERSHEKVLLAHLQQPARSARLVEPSVPEALDAILLKALAKMPTARFDGATEMRAALTRLLSTKAPQLSSSRIAPSASQHAAVTVRIDIEPPTTSGDAEPNTVLYPAGPWADAETLPESVRTDSVQGYGVPLGGPGSAGAVAHQKATTPLRRVLAPGRSDLVRRRLLMALLVVLVILIVFLSATIIRRAQNRHLDGFETPATHNHPQTPGGAARNGF